MQYEVDNCVLINWLKPLAEAGISRIFILPLKTKCVQTIDVVR
jgi:hypothetical protein